MAEDGPSPQGADYAQTWNEVSFFTQDSPSSPLYTSGGSVPLSDLSNCSCVAVAADGDDMAVVQWPVEDGGYDSVAEHHGWL
jgi:hypothetical protein